MNKPPHQYTIKFSYKGTKLSIHLWDINRAKARYRAAKSAAASFHCSVWEALLHVEGARRVSSQLPLF